MLPKRQNFDFLPKFIMKMSKNHQIEDSAFLNVLYVTGISEVTAVESGSEDVLKQSVFENGPNSIAIDASSIGRGKTKTQTNFLKCVFNIYSKILFRYRISRRKND